MVNIYPVDPELPTSLEPDTASRDIAVDYLKDRLRPRRTPAPLRIGVTSSDIAIPVPTSERSDWHVRVPEQRPKHEGYVRGWTPKRSVMSFVAATLAVQAFVNGAHVISEVKYGVDTLKYEMGPKVTYSQVHTEVAGPEVVITQDLSYVNKAGKTEVNPKAIATFTRSVETALRRGDTLDAVGVQSGASDEYRGDSSLGVINPANEQLAKRREDNAVPVIVKGLSNLPETRSKHPGTTIALRVKATALETVLSKTDAQELKSTAKADGYPSATEAVHDYASIPQQKRFKKLRSLVSKVINSRGVKAEAVVLQPSQTTHETVSISHQVPKPTAPDKGWSKWVFPGLPFLRRRKLADKAMPGFKLGWKEGFKLPKLTIIPKRNGDNAWIRITRETVDADGRLNKTPWAGTRKVRHLFRDERISTVLRGDFTTSGGKEQALRVMFVDHTPDQQAIDTYKTVLDRASNMQGGEIATKVSGIFVYPERNGGTKHKDARRIAIGFDKQDDGVLGVHTPAMRSIEMVAPDDLTPENLEKELAAFMGPTYTLGHELSHSLNAPLEPTRLKRVFSPTDGETYITDTDWGTQGQRAHTSQRHLLDTKNPRTFTVTHTAVDRDGRAVTRTERGVPEGDRLLQSATSVTIEKRRPTVYGSGNSEEHLAEAGGSILTGIEIPGSEAGVSIGNTTGTDNFATGYRPSTVSQRAFTEAAGAIQGEYPAAFSTPNNITFTVGTVNDDPLLQDLAHQARTSRMPRPRDMVTIVTKQTNRISK